MFGVFYISLPVSYMLGRRLSLVLLVIAAWCLWFAIKLLIGRFVLHEGDDVWREVYDRLSIAGKSSSETIFTAISLLRLILLSLFHWADVFLPFVQDTWYVTRTLVWPFANSRVLVPLARWLSPLPLLVWNGWTWFNQTVDLEYRFALACFFVLFFSKRLDPFVKTFLSTFLGILLTYRWTAGLLGLEHFKFFIFVLIPASISVHSLLVAKPSLNRLGNILLYLAVSPAVILIESRIGIMSAPLVHVVVTPGLYALWTAWMYCLNEDWVTRDFRVIVNRACVRFPRLKPFADSILRMLRDRFPIVSRIEEKLGSMSFNSLALSAITGQHVGIIGKVMALIRSTPVLALIALASGLFLGILYWVHTTASSLLVLALWPWWVIDTLKICLYDRREDFRGQLAFSVVFIAIELFLQKQQSGFMAFILNVFHLPIIVVIKLMPLVVVQVLSRILSFLPLLMVAPMLKRPAKLEDESKPIEQVVDPPKRKSSSVTKRRSTTEK